MQTRDVSQRQAAQTPGFADRFGLAFDALKRAWAVESRYNPFYPFLTWTQSGARLGASTLVARKVRGEEARLLALLSVASGFPAPASALKDLVAAEREFERGNPARSAMHVRSAGIPALRASENARLLYVAAGMLDQGFVSPADLMKACELDCAPLESIDRHGPSGAGLRFREPALGREGR
jgi:hypothetical protein